ncbi:MAG: hypothetical protein R3C15_00375 [Thermoleophilia bacterium]
MPWAPSLACAGRCAALVAALALAGAGAGCSSSDDGADATPTAPAAAPPRTEPASGPAAARTRLHGALERLPDVPELRRHVLFGDLAALRRAYGDGWNRSRLAGVWLPDALLAADRRPWREAFGRTLDRVDAFAAAGFHPAAVAVATGSFQAGAIRASLRRAGFARRGASSSGARTGRSTRRRPPAASCSRRSTGWSCRASASSASTTALARAAAAAGPTLGERPDLTAAADALGQVTAAAIQDAELVRPPAGTPTRVIATREASIVGVGVEDRAGAGATLRIALVYGSEEDARAEAAALDGDTLAAADLPGAGDRRLGDVATGWRAEAVGRAVRLEAALAPGEGVGVWRSLLESGDLAVLVYSSSAVIR